MEQRLPLSLWDTNYATTKALVDGLIEEEYSAEAAAVISRMTGLVTAEKTAIAAFVDTMETAGLWTLLDEFTHYGMQTEANSLKGWKAKTSTANNAPTHTPGTGFTFVSGSSQSISTDFVPSVDGVNYVLDNAQSGIFIVTDSSTSPAADAEYFNGVLLRLQRLTGTDNLRINVNGGNKAIAGTGSVSLTNKLVWSFRDTDSTIKLIVDDANPYGNIADSSISVSSDEIYVGSASGGGDRFVDGVISCHFVGAGSGLNWATFNTALRQLNTDLAAV